MLEDEDAGHPVSRVLSLLLALVYVVTAWRSAGVGVAVKIASSCVLPLACIWFPDILGEGSGRITAPSPASFVWFLGWVVLLVPMIGLMLIVLRT